MNKQIYTITELANELNQARQNVRRRLLKLSIKAVNEHTREHKTDPLLYDFKTLKILSENFGLVQRTSDSTTKEQVNEQAKEQAENDIFVVLKEQLEHEREQNKKLSKLNENLLNQLDKNQTLLDQQQRLSLNDRNKIEVLELEVKSTQERKDKTIKKKKWKGIFKK